MRRLLPVLVLVLGGCSSSAQVPVRGAVTWGDAPVAHAVVTFYPDENTSGLGGFGRTDAAGKYALTPARGGSGIEPGSYTVVISLMLRKDNTPPPPDVPPIESDAVEKLPAMYSSRAATTLKATVSKDQSVHDFTLRKAP
jgi:hypothetical protein